VNLAPSLEKRSQEERRPIRFVVFGIVAILAVSGLTARLYYLQITNGAHNTTLADVNRSVIQAIPSSRGLIYDRNGAVLVTNIPIYSVKVRPGDLPLGQRDAVVATLSRLLSMDRSEIISAIDSASNRFDLVRIATDIPKSAADFIAESHLDLPGVEVDVEARRQYANGALLSQILGYSGPINAQQLADLRSKGYLPDDVIGKTGIEAQYETVLRGQYGSETVERNAAGERGQVLEMISEAQPGDSLQLTIDTHQQQLAEKALKWSMQSAGIKRGVFIVMNPQTGEIQAMVSLPTYDDNLFARGISNQDFQKLLDDPNKPLLNHAISEQFPPGSTYKVVTGSGALADKKITASTQLITRGYLSIGSTRFYDWNRAGFGSCNIYCGFGNSSDTFFYQVAGMLGIDRLAYWAKQYGFGAQTGIDLPGEVPGIVPTNQWKLDTFGEPIFPGDVYHAGIGQGFDSVTPLQLINAYAALANGGNVMVPQVVHEVLGPDGSVVRAFTPQVERKLAVPASALKTMREAARNVALVRHTNTLVEMPIVVAGKTGTAEFGVRDNQGRLPYDTWFVGFLPKDPYRHANDPTGFKAVDRTDSNLIVLAFLYDANTIGNSALEAVKYYLQLRFDIKQDYRKPDYIKRGNFYGSN
jgi:penicillin-binding protein 2